MLLALVDGVAVAAAFLIALNLRSAEIRHEFFAAPGWPMLIVLLTWYVSAELIDGYRLVNTVTPRAAFTTAASALTVSFVAWARGFLHRAVSDHAADTAAVGSRRGGIGTELADCLPEDIRPRHLCGKFADD
ncbi:MAG: hypothetical protein WBE69_15130, partial [Candidatus Binataceae bacterium]